jgi:hypothetical protein
MRIAPGLAIDDSAQGVRVVARDWPWAPWFAAPALAAGLPLMVWSAVTGHLIEFGGGLVFCAFGGVCAWLSAAKRRDVEISAAIVRGREGAGPFAREVDVALTAPVRLNVRAFPVPEGAPDLADRGGDLVLAWPGGEFLLARRAGAGWREALEAARARVVGRIPEFG